jgi:hypothetical protein
MKHKSRLMSFLCTFVFGSFGLFYTSAAAAFLGIIAHLTLAVLFGTFGLVLAWIGAILVGDHLVQEHNESIDDFYNKVLGK